MRRLLWVTALGLFATAGALAQVPPANLLVNSAAESDLPDAPGMTWSSKVPLPLDQNAPAARPAAETQGPAPCLPAYSLTNYGPVSAASRPNPLANPSPCPPDQNQYRPFVDAGKTVHPLTPRQKGKLAIRDVKDPFNLLTIAGTSAYFIGTTPHNPYGPGMRGFGYNAGVSLSQDVTGEFIGTFLVCSLFHQDPRYFRMPHARPLRRLAHAISHVAVAQGDDGRPMPNYQNFITSGVSAVISNLYVPGIATDPASTTERIFGGFLTEPIGTIIAEFLPDVASHIHVNIVIVQRYLNQISAQNGPAPGVFGLP